MFDLNRQLFLHGCPTGEPRCEGGLRAEFVGSVVARRPDTIFIRGSCSRLGAIGPPQSETRQKNPEKIARYGDAQGGKAMIYLGDSGRFWLCESFLTKSVDSSSGHAYNALHRRRRRQHGALRCWFYQTTLPHRPGNRIVVRRLWLKAFKPHLLIGEWFFDNLIIEGREA